MRSPHLPSLPLHVYPPLICLHDRSDPTLISSSSSEPSPSPSHLASTPLLKISGLPTHIAKSCHDSSKRYVLPVARVLGATQRRCRDFLVYGSLLPLLYISYRSFSWKFCSFPPFYIAAGQHDASTPLSLQCCTRQRALGYNTITEHSFSTSPCLSLVKQISSHFLYFFSPFLLTILVGYVATKQ